MSNYVSYITLPGSETKYVIHDAEAHSRIDSMTSIKFDVVWNGEGTTVDESKVPYGVDCYNKSGVKVGTGTLAAGSADAGTFYLVYSYIAGEPAGSKDVYAEYIAAGDPKAWEKIGDTGLIDPTGVSVTYYSTDVAAAPTLDYAYVPANTFVDSVTITKGDAINALTPATSFTTTVGNTKQSLTASVSGGSITPASDKFAYGITTTDGTVSATPGSVTITPASASKLVVANATVVTAVTDATASVINEVTPQEITPINVGADVTASYISNVAKSNDVKVVNTAADATATYITAADTVSGHIVTDNTAVTIAYAANGDAVSASGSVSYQYLNPEYDGTDTLNFSWGTGTATATFAGTITGTSHTASASNITSTAGKTFITGTDVTGVEVTKVTTTTTDVVTGITATDVTANKCTAGTAFNVVGDINYGSVTAKNFTADSMTVATGEVSTSGTGGTVAVAGTAVTVSYVASVTGGTFLKTATLETKDALTGATLVNPSVSIVAGDAAEGAVNVVTAIGAVSTSATGYQPVMAYSASVTGNKNNANVDIDAHVSYTTKHAVDYDQGIKATLSR